MNSRRFVAKQAVALFAATSRAEILGTTLISSTLVAVAIYGLWLTSRTLDRASPSAITRDLVPPLAIGLMAGITAIGSMLGSSVAAAEIERGTAQFGWSMTGRRAWLAFRTLPAAGAAVVAMIPVTLALGWLAAARHPGVGSADDYGLAGALPTLRVLLVFCVALLLGLTVGRSMAALIGSFAIGLTCMAALFLAWPFGATPSAFAGDAPNGSRAVGTLYRTVDGQLLDLAAAQRLAPPSVDPVSMSEWMAGAYEPVTLAITPTQLDEVMIREAALISSAISVLTVTSLLVVDRRRPR